MWGSIVQTLGAGLIIGGGVPVFYDFGIVWPVSGAGLVLLVIGKYIKRRS